MTGNSMPLLSTKMQLPRQGPQNVPRPALWARLDAGLDLPFTLLSAPAGFGKTLVLAAWIVTHTEPTHAVPIHAAWLTMEASDNDPLRFWSYVTAALAALPERDSRSPLHELQAQLRAPIAPTLEEGIEALLAILSAPRAPSVADDGSAQAAAAHIVLVLDDYHQIHSRRIHETLNFFVTHLPPHVHVIVSTRADPPLPLNRWRVNGALLELRAADLCFTVEEAGAMLSRRTKLVLPPEEVEKLVDFADGWPAGLQLLGVSLQGRSRSEISTRLHTFTNSSHFVLAYVLEEVLQNQPEPVRRFLLRTSILQRFNAPLCDELLDTDGDSLLADDATGSDAPLHARAILNYLEAHGLFVVSLDDEEGWYRYYHLFAQALRDELERAEPTLSLELHRRAARWYDRHGFAAEAIEHALSAQDWPHAADLLAAAGRTILVHGSSLTLSRWIEMLPPGEIAARPRLAILRGWLLVLSGPLAAVQEVVEYLLSGPELSAAGAASARYPAAGEVAALGTMLAAYRWEVHKALALGEEALRTLAPDDLFSLAAVHHALGHALGLSGRGNEAIAHYMRAQAYGYSLGSTYMVLFPLFRLGHTYLDLGALSDAEAIYRRGLQLAVDHGGNLWPSLADGYMGMAAILRERNDLLGAEHFSNRAMALAPARSVSVLASASAINAHIQQTLKRHIASPALLGDAIRAAQTYNSPYMVAWLRACQARLDLGAGDLNAARQWAETQADAWNETGYYPEFEELTLARFYLADHRPRAALALLQLWQARAEARGRVRSLIEIGVLQAEAQWVLGLRAEAQRSLCRALALAEPERFQRLFLDEDERLLPLLEAIAPRDDCAAHLLATLQSGHATTREALLAGPLDHLTPRELEILRAIARGASNQQVAETFVLTVGTVKGHVNHILSKLGAGNRTEAVARAREIGLI